jgi:hypothetical protein
MFEAFFVFSKHVGQMHDHLLDAAHLTQVRQAHGQSHGPTRATAILDCTQNSSSALCIVVVHPYLESAGPCDCASRLDRLSMSV